MFLSREDVFTRALGETGANSGARDNPCTYDAIVTIRFANRARALPTHLPRSFSGAFRYPKLNSGRRLGNPQPAAAHLLPELSAVAQRYASHRPAADALDAGEELHLLCPAAAAVVAHLLEDVADPHGAL